MKSQKICNSYMANRKIYIFALIICMLLIHAIELVVMAELLRQFIQNMQDRKTIEIYRILKYLLGSVWILMGAKMLEKKLLFSGKKYISLGMQKSILDKLHRIKYPEYFIRQEDIFSLVNQQNDRIIESYLTYCVQLAESVIAILLGSLYVGINFPLPYAICIMVTLVVIWILRKDLHKLPGFQKEWVEKQEELHQLSWDQVKNTEVAAFLNKKGLFRGYLKKTDSFIKHWKKRNRIMAKTDMLKRFSGNLIIILISLIAAFLLGYREMGIGDLFALVLVLPKISSFCMLLPEQIAQGQVHQGVFRELDEKIFLFEEEAGGEIIHRARSIQVQNLAGGYQEQEKVFRNLFLSVDEGMFAVIVGKSGSGKTTFLKICTKLLPALEGKILLDGIELNKIERNSLWREVGFYSNDPTIFSETILYNITLSRDKIDETRLQKAIQIADLDRYLQILEKGMQTIVDAKSISDGEQQKIIIARAVYQDRNIILFDEPFSKLSQDSIQRIVPRLKRFCQEESKIMIVASHLPMIEKLADLTICLDANGGTK